MSVAPTTNIRYDKKLVKEEYLIMWAGEIKISDHIASLGREKFWLAREKLAPLVGNWDLDYVATLPQHRANQSKVRTQGNWPMRWLEILYDIKAIKIQVRRLKYDKFIMSNNKIPNHLLPTNIYRHHIQDTNYTIHTWDWYPLVGIICNFDNKC